jgi:hypothetical protein
VDASDLCEAASRYCHVAHDSASPNRPNSILPATIPVLWTLLTRRGRTNGTRAANRGCGSNDGSTGPVEVPLVASSVIALRALQWSAHLFLPSLWKFVTERKLNEKRGRRRRQAVVESRASAASLRERAARRLRPGQGYKAALQQWMSEQRGSSSTQELDSGRRFKSFETPP